MLVPFLLGARRASPGTAAAGGACFGLAATVSVAWWFPSMLQGYFGASAAQGIGALLAAGLALDALPYALFAAWLAGCAGSGALAPLRVGCAWALAELLRTQGPLGNPVGLLGYAALDTPLSQLADLGGPFLVSGLLAAANLAVADLILGRERSQRGALACAITLALALAYGVARERQRFETGPPVKVALVQPGVARKPDWDRALRAAHLERSLDLLRRLELERPRLVFLPEFGVDFYLREDTPERARLERAVQELGAELVTGGAAYRLAPDGAHYYNSVFLLDASGRALDRYDKLQLVPFAEYGPFGPQLRSATAVYERGKGPRVLHAEALSVGAFICGESLFPWIARRLSGAGAAVLANPSNDYWMVHPAAQEQQLQMARMRAIENRRWLARATSTGVSGLVDPHGRVISRSGTRGPETLVGEVRASTVTTAYQRGGELWLAVSLLALTLDAARRRPSHRRER